MVKTHMYKIDIIKTCMNKHLTADQVFEKMKKKHPKIWLSTIYRNLREMVDCGEIKKLEVNSDKSVFETNIGEHIHIIDQETGDIIDIEQKELPKCFVPDWFTIEKMEINIYWSFKKAS